MKFQNFYSLTMTGLFVALVVRKIIAYRNRPPRIIGWRYSTPPNW